MKFLPIDRLRNPLVQIRNLVRGLNPYPTAWTTLVRDGKSTDVKVFAVSPASGQESSLLRRINAPQSDPAASAEVEVKSADSQEISRHGNNEKAGTIWIDGGRLLVKAGDSWLEVKELQLAGKKRMSADAFLRGFREIEQYRFE